jgi:hypothetical protein
MQGGLKKFCGTKPLQHLENSKPPALHILSIDITDNPHRNIDTSFYRYEVLSIVYNVRLCLKRITVWQLEVDIHKSVFAITDDHRSVQLPLSQIFLLFAG